MQQNVSATKQREFLLKSVTIASVSVAAILVITKLIAWWMSDSVSLLASLIDSGMDAGASLINMFAVRYALQPADDEHRFGHGKAEALASLMQSILIAASSVLLVIHALDRLYNPQPISAIDAAFAVMLFSLVLTIALVGYQKYVVKITRSTAVAADSLHYVADILANIAVIVALVMASYGIEGADTWLGILIGLYIAHSAYEIFREAIDLLLDREIGNAEREEIEKTVLAVPGVEGVHDLRTRCSGDVVFVQMHLELPDQMPLVEAHAISEDVELKVAALFDRAEVLVHQDPVSVS